MEVPPGKRGLSWTKLIWNFICSPSISFCLSLFFDVSCPLFSPHLPLNHSAPTTSRHHRTTNRFSSGDLSSEVDDVDPNSLPPAARPIQDQPTKPPAVGGGGGGSGGGPPNMPPPPAPGQPAGAAPELSLSFGAGKAPPTTAAPGPPRGVSAPTSPAKSRESLLQRVQSLTGAARDQGASILGTASIIPRPTLRETTSSRHIA